MAKSECFCEIDKHNGHSCESVLITNKRFRFDKFENVIVDGGIVDNSITNCELKCRVTYKDKNGIHNCQGDKQKRLK